ncbi:DUF6503 family protein [Bizionia algoritergicola]|uniref:Threonine synthase n=2 Tax=Bizionia TaxID=283785 RepID=A0A5D0QSL4_9FLAO|nr:DUF6503 family protein [Bizionia algoritergicola]OBX17462.1 hypothetical protein BAA08_16370 [Bizionia sp. APA-3]TYB71681.1 hypothetical protein ES675_14145 [Bizionia algoritergicola]
MKNYILAMTILVVFSACKQNNAKPETIETSEETVGVVEVEKTKYPENLTKVFDAHGGIDAWKSMKSIAFTMEKPDGKEVTTTNLNSREALIESPNANIGFDGSKAWFLNKTEGDYQGYEPLYYYNLMFYFYAMPFVLSDDGINYAEAEPLVFEGVTYPGIQITYNVGVGETPEDRYVLYYNPTTYQMEWLGYTVSFVPGIDKKELHFRRYDNWQKVNGLLLPKTIVGYGFKDDKPTEAKKSTEFIDVQVTDKEIESSKFAKPEKGEFVN